MFSLRLAPDEVSRSGKDIPGAAVRGIVATSPSLLLQLPLGSATMPRTGVVPVTSELPGSMNPGRHSPKNASEKTKGRYGSDPRSLFRLFTSLLAAAFAR